MSATHPLKPTPQAGCEFATLAGGSFWSLEAVYREVKGVRDVEVGYSGGSLGKPSYEAVCGGTTGHAEVVRVEFEPARLSYRQILEIFFAIHDPTTLNRQGKDVGTQYRSVIYFHGTLQQHTASEALSKLAKELERPVVTELLMAPEYWRAEPYHQEYFARHPEQGYCAGVVAPKLAKFRERFASLLKN